MEGQSSSSESSVDEKLHVAEEETPQGDVQQAKVKQNDYWGWAERVKGTLSSINLSSLATAKDTTQDTVELSSTSPTTCSDQTSKPDATKGGYWEWQETIKKTLSSVSLTTMGHIAVAPKKNVENEVSGDASPATNNNRNYWHWRNSFKSASDLLRQAETQPQTDVPTTDGAASTEDNPNRSYWFWRNPSFASLSKTTSVEQLDDKNVDEKNDGNVMPNSPSPISKLDHKLRTSWRKSFQKLSSNSLTKLDEGKEDTKGTSWKESFRTFQKSVQSVNTDAAPNKPFSQVEFTTTPSDIHDENNEASLMCDDSHSSLGGINF